MPAAGVPAGFRQLPDLGAIHPSFVGEEQDPVVVGGDEQMLDLIVGAQRCPAYTLAAALLHPIKIGVGAFGVAASGDRDYHFRVGDQVLVRKITVGGNDLGTSLVAVLLDDLAQLLADDLSLPLRLRQDVDQVGNDPLVIGWLID